MNMFKDYVKDIIQIRLGENLEYKSYKAYSLNKGEEIVLCLHDKDGKLITDKNTMKFVLIHELHIL